MLNVIFLTRIIKIHLYLHTTFRRNDKSRKITFSYAHHVRKRHSHSFPAGGPWSVLFFGQDNFSLESLRSLYNEQSVLASSKSNLFINFIQQKIILYSEEMCVNLKYAYKISTAKLRNSADQKLYRYAERKRIVSYSLQKRRESLLMNGLL